MTQPKRVRSSQISTRRRKFLPSRQKSRRSKKPKEATYQKSRRRSNPTKQTVVIRAAQATTLQPVVNVMDVGNRTGVSDYSVTTKSGRRINSRVFRPTANDSPVALRKRRRKSPGAALHCKAANRFRFRIILFPPTRHRTPIPCSSDRRCRGRGRRADVDRSTIGIGRARCSRLAYMVWN